ncbi:MAG: CRISPR-associated helicase Cas3' [Candidatus Methanomethylicia archaeon]
MSFLDKIREKGLDLSKETHPGKSYEEHVKECREVAEEIMRIYNYPRNLIELALLFCDVHDIGKLLHTWHISQKRRPLHSIEGAEWFMYVKENIGLSINQAYQELIAYMIASHHSPLYVPTKFMDIVSRAEKMSTKRYFIEYRKCKGLVNKINGLLRSLDKEVRHNLADVLGIVKMADLVSAKGLSKNEILTNYMWLEGFEERTDKGIFERACDKRGAFDQIKFERQKMIASSEDKHLLVAAPTGWGKTALALLRVALKKPVKVFYILPTITAIKDFYESFTKILDKNYVGEYFYFADVELLKKDYEEEHPLDIYRYFIPKITITTIDQLLLTTLQTGKYYIRRFNLRNSLIILDEFHLLTPEMIACIRVFLKNLLKSYKLSCLFMSATPSPIYEELLKEVLPQMKITILSDEYNKLKRHKINYVSDHCIEELISEKEELLKKKRTLIIVNTVNEAQHLYKILKERLNGTKKVTLIHGDFAYKDRIKKEEQIDSSDILISTQVAEVSLDISFDLLITELAPIPSLVQRFGRVNRYGKIAEEINVYICKPKSDKPYGYIMLKEAHKVFPFLINGIEQCGEAAYLNREFWQYEEIFREKVIEIENKISRKMDEFMLNFFSFLAQEREILEFLGREETWLAIPEIYLDEALDLFQKLKSTNKYEERMNMYAKIKENFVPISFSDIKRADWSDELKMWIIKNYDKDLGMIRKDAHL